MRAGGLAKVCLLRRVGAVSLIKKVWVSFHFVSVSVSVSV